MREWIRRTARSGGTPRYAASDMMSDRDRRPTSYERDEKDERQNRKASAFMYLRVVTNVDLA